MFSSISILLIAGHQLGDGTLIDTIPYQFPAYEASREAQRASTKEEYEAAIGDSEFSFSKVRYSSSGLRVVAYFYQPSKKGVKLPTVVFNRGSGPRGDVAPEVISMFHRLAKAGFAVVAPMYRGTDGGEGTDEMGGADLADLINVSSLLRNLSFAAQDKVFLYGESRGAMMVYQALRDGFPCRAASVFGGFTDLDRMLKENPRQLEGVRQLIPDFDSVREEFTKRRSALGWADKLAVPLLIMHGGADQTVNPHHAFRLGEALVAQGREVEFHVYAGDGHVLSKNRLDRDARTVSWFRRHALIADK